MTCGLCIVVDVVLCTLVSFPDPPRSGDETMCTQNDLERL